MKEKSGGISKAETLAANTSSPRGLLGTHRDGCKKGNKEREQMEAQRERIMVDGLQDVERVKQKMR